MTVNDNADAGGRVYISLAYLIQSDITYDGRSCEALCQWGVSRRCLSVVRGFIRIPIHFFNQIMCCPRLKFYIYDIYNRWHIVYFTICRIPDATVLVLKFQGARTHQNIQVGHFASNLSKGFMNHDLLMRQPFHRKRVQISKRQWGNFEISMARLLCST